MKTFKEFNDRLDEAGERTVTSKQITSKLDKLGEYYELMGIYDGIEYIYVQSTMENGDMGMDFASKAFEKYFTVLLNT